MIDDEQDKLVLVPSLRTVESLTKSQLKQVTISQRVLKEALAVEQEDAKDSGNLGYLARMLVQATMPHSRLTQNEFSRTNGSLTISILAPSHIGLPYGHYPRLLLSWITTEAVQTKSPTLVLGASLSDFLRQLGIGKSGGENGTIPRLREHMRRLFCSTVSWTYGNKNDNSWQSFGIQPVESAKLWWDPKNPDQQDLWKSYLCLNQRFYDEIVNKPVPVDMRILKVLSQERSPLAIDIYTWLSYRLFYLRERTTIPWEALALQFGGDYTRIRDFKKSFNERLSTVMRLYPDARVLSVDAGLQLAPSFPSIAPKR